MFILNPAEHEFSTAHKNRIAEKITIVLALKLLDVCIYPANKCKTANNYWHFNIYEQDKLCALLS